METVESERTDTPNDPEVFWPPRRATEYPTDERLIERAVMNARPRKPGKHVRWSAVADAFGLGSTFSFALCKRFGVDPEEQIEGPSCEACEERGDQ